MNFSTESIPWSSVGATGTQVATSLPKIVRTFEDYATVDLYIGDNDPVYFSVVKARQRWGYDWAARFCVGMMTYYHMGTAVKAADLTGADFWDYLWFRFNDAPRGAARRHFRGANGTSGLKSMQAYAPQPERFFTTMPDNYLGIKKECGNHLAQFGPYFWLKIADYMDRCLDKPITSWAGLGQNLSTEPARAAQQLGSFQEACERVYDLNLLASPTYDRPAGPSEVETILCDWSHAKKGTNWLGADLIVKRYALKGYGGKAAQMSDWLPPLVDRNEFKLELV